MTALDFIGVLRSSGYRLQEDSVQTQHGNPGSVSLVGEGGAVFLDVETECVLPGEEQGDVLVWVLQELERLVGHWSLMECLGDYVCHVSTSVTSPQRKFRGEGETMTEAAMGALADVLQAQGAVQ